MDSEEENTSSSFEDNVFQREVASKEENWSNQSQGSSFSERSSYETSNDNISTINRSSHDEDSHDSFTINEVDRVYSSEEPSLFPSSLPQSTLNTSYTRGYSTEENSTFNLPYSQSSSDIAGRGYSEEESTVISSPDSHNSSDNSASSGQFTDVSQSQSTSDASFSSGHFIEDPLQFTAFPYQSSSYKTFHSDYSSGNPSTFVSSNSQSSGHSTGKSSTFISSHSQSSQSAGKTPITILSQTQSSGHSTGKSSTFISSHSQSSQSAGKTPITISSQTQSSAHSTGKASTFISTDSQRSGHSNGKPSAFFSSHSQSSQSAGKTPITISSQTQSSAHSTGKASTFISTDSQRSGHSTGKSSTFISSHSESGHSARKTPTIISSNTQSSSHSIGNAPIFISTHSQRSDQPAGNLKTPTRISSYTQRRGHSPGKRSTFTTPKSTSGSPRAFSVTDPPPIFERNNEVETEVPLISITRYPSSSSSTSNLQQAQKQKSSRFNLLSASGESNNLSDQAAMFSSPEREHFNIEVEPTRIELTVSHSSPHLQHSNSNGNIRKIAKSNARMTEDRQVPIYSQRDLPSSERSLSGNPCISFWEPEITYLLSEEDHSEEEMKNVELHQESEDSDKNDDDRIEKISILNQNNLQLNIPLLSSFNQGDDTEPVNIRPITIEDVASALKEIKGSNEDNDEKNSIDLSGSWEERFSQPFVPQPPRTPPIIRPAPYSPSILSCSTPTRSFYGDKLFPDHFSISITPSSTSSRDPQLNEALQSRLVWDGEHSEGDTSDRESFSSLNTPSQENSSHRASSTELCSLSTVYQHQQKSTRRQSFSSWDSPPQGSNVELCNLSLVQQPSRIPLQRVKRRKQSAELHSKASTTIRQTDTKQHPMKTERCSSPRKRSALMEHKRITKRKVHAATSLIAKHASAKELQSTECQDIASSSNKQVSAHHSSSKTKKHFAKQQSVTPKEKVPKIYHNVESGADFKPVQLTSSPIRQRHTAVIHSTLHLDKPSLVPTPPRTKKLTHQRTSLKHSLQTEKSSCVRQTAIPRKNTASKKGLLARRSSLTVLSPSRTKTSSVMQSQSAIKQESSATTRRIKSKVETLFATELPISPRRQHSPKRRPISPSPSSQLPSTSQKIWQQPNPEQSTSSCPVKEHAFPQSTFSPCTKQIMTIEKPAANKRGFLIRWPSSSDSS